MISRRLRVLSSALVCVAALSACGDDEGSSAADPASTSGASATPTETPTPTPTPTEPTPSASVVPSGPACDEIWVADATLPGDYRGCVASGAWVKADKKPCSFGKPIVTFDDRFYAVPGKVVNDVGNLRTSERYQRALAACQA
jgi:hypothetical protein